MRGLRTIRSAWKNPLYAPRPRQVSVTAPLTPEQVEARRAEEAERIRQFLERNSSGFTKMKDREARIAVEGDTDLNHDNVEAAE